MRLVEKNLTWMVEEFLLDDNLAWIVEGAIRRRFSEDEGREIHDLIKAAIVTSLSEYEFADEEPVPKIDGVQVWADDHKGVGFRRPKGQVIYTVTGEVVKHRHGLITGCPGPTVQRSSDGKEIPMTITELESMVQV